MRELPELTKPTMVRLGTYTHALPFVPTMLDVLEEVRRAQGNLPNLLILSPLNFDTQLPIVQM